MASDEVDFGRRVAAREYPSCPPQGNNARDKQYGASLLKAKTGGNLLHHAALFACTRWTNLYFDRDIIGGRIEKLGDWIDNQRLETARLVPAYKVLGEQCAAGCRSRAPDQSRPSRSGARSQGVVDGGTEPSRRDHRSSVSDGASLAMTPVKG